MIEDLIEGIACYCDTYEKITALNNISRVFSMWSPKLYKDDNEKGNVYDPIKTDEDRKRAQESLDKRMRSVKGKGYQMGGGALGGAGLGVLIGDRISKKKGWSRTKGRIIGGLLGAAGGTGLGYSGARLYEGNEQINYFNHAPYKGSYKLK
jgi:hypothetical protein